MNVPVSQEADSLVTSSNLPASDDSAATPTLATSTRLLASLVIAVSVSTLAGWYFDINVLKRIHPLFVAMNPATAVSFILCAVSLLTLRSSKAAFLGTGCSVIALLIAVAKVLQLKAGIPFAVDKILFTAALEAERIPNSMAPNTAVNFVLLSAILCWLHLKPRGTTAACTIISLLLAVLSLFAIVGYAIGVNQLYQVSNYIAMACHTAANFLLLSVALILELGGRNAIRTQFLWKVYAGFSMLILLTTAIIGFHVDRLMRAEFQHGSQQQLQAIAELLANSGLSMLDSSNKDAAASLQALGQTTGIHLSLLSPSGTYIADSDPANLVAQNDNDAPEIANARLHGIGTAMRSTTADSEQTLFVAVPIVRDGTRVGFARAALPVATTQAQVTKLRGALLLGADIAMIVAIIGGFLFAKKVTEPLVVMTTAANDISAGKEYSRIGQSSDDEFGKLATAFDSMALELRRRMEELGRSRIQSDAANEAKSMFLANMSHEIRTPLNGIVGLLDLLARSDLTSQQIRYIQLCKTSATALSTLINDILDFSKIEAGKLELDHHPFAIRELVEDILDLLGRNALARGVELVAHVATDVPVEVVGDPLRLRQIITNLISNAVKFTETGGVTLQASVESSEDNAIAIRFTVTDTGIGIAPHHMEQLFAPFSQGDPTTTRRYGGTGLGLAICRRLVELMGGTVTAKSTVGIGSVFSFDAWFALDSAVKAPAIFHHLANPFRVLAVDDHATAREALRLQIESWGFEVTVVADAASALASLRAGSAERRPYTVAVLDEEMPEIGGLELGMLIKADANLRETVLMILLSPERAPEVIHLQALGFAASMTKPVRQSELFDTIMNAVHGPHTTLQAAAALPAPEQKKARTQVQSKKILLAEDNEINRIVATEILGLSGFTCSIAHNGREAVTAATTNDFDLVLMDCQMPEMDGFEATKMIREWERNSVPRRSKRLPIVALTANAIAGDRERCLEAGMDAHVPKPLNPELLLGTISSLLELRFENVEPAETRTVAAQRSCAPFAVNAILERCMNNQSAVKSILSKFADECTQLLQQLTDGIRAEDTQAIVLASHTLRGIASVVAADTLYHYSLELETLGVSNNFDEAASRLPALVVETERCIRHVPEALHALNSD